MLNPKIADHHLIRQARIYIRQSTPAQVRLNQESTERQYNLANQARALGSIPEQIRILDGDLAQSGELTIERDDFKALVSGDGCYSPILARPDARAPNSAHN
jgi:autotransporter translocation and assembly factor TamB